MNRLTTFTKCDVLGTETEQGRIILKHQTGSHCRKHSCFSAIAYLACAKGSAASQQRANIFQNTSELSTIQGMRPENISIRYNIPSLRPGGQSIQIMAQGKRFSVPSLRPEVRGICPEVPAPGMEQTALMPKSGARGYKSGAQGWKSRAQGFIPGAWGRKSGALSR